MAQCFVSQKYVRLVSIYRSSNNAAVDVSDDKKGPSKGELKKREKEAEKERKRLEREAKEASAKAAREAADVVGFRISR